MATNQVIESDRPIFIVADGGPASGKSQLISMLRKRYPNLIYVQEAATAVFAAGYPLPFQGMTEDLVETQTTIFNFQRGMERMALREATADKVRIVILDRAAISGEAYMPGGADEFYDQIAGASKSELIAHYDEVWGCISLAKFDEVAYNQLRLTNPHRSESAAQASEMDDRTQAVWQDHPKYIRMPSEQGLEAMLAKAVERIQKHQLSEIERKWLMPKGSLDRLLRTNPEVLVKTTRIDQGYLWSDSNTRIRREDTTFTLTSKLGVGLERVEFEPTLPEAIFEEMWPKTEGRRVAKKRNYLAGGYEYDFYLDQLAGLETVERTFFRVEDAAVFTLDQRLVDLGAREVTGQREWGNHWLSVNGWPKDS